MATRSRSNDGECNDRAAHRVRLDGREPPATDARVDFSQLPHSIVSGRIFDFLAAVESMDFLRHGLSLSEWKATQTPLAQVCREWRTIIQSRAVDAKHASLRLCASTGNLKECRRILQHATEHGRKALALRISMAHGDTIHPHYNDAEWWESLFKCVPNLVQLDLTEVHGVIFPMVLSTASRLCPRLQSLFLSCGPFREATLPAIPAMMQALVEALQGWHNSCGGLRVLTIPSFVPMYDDLYAAFFQTVAATCPRLEYLAWDVNCGMNRGWRVNDLAVDIWAEFCRGCPLVQSFLWGAVPCSLEYVKPFIAAPKRFLEELTIVPDDYHDWSDMKGLTLLHELIKAAPRLRTFQFHFTDALAHRSKPLANSLSEIAKTLAAYCPDLKEVALYDCSKKQKYRISAEAVEALANLESLVRLTIPPVSIGDQTLVKVLRSRRLIDGHHRSIVLQAEGYIHNAIVKLLQALLDDPADRFECVSLLLSLTGTYSMKKDGSILPPPTQEKLQPVQLKELVEAVKHKHKRSLSYISVNVVTERVSNRVMHYISTFELRINVNKSGAKVCGFDERDGAVGGVVVEPEARIKHY